jgi:hypothetical protein
MNIILEYSDSNTIGNSNPNTLDSPVKSQSSIGSPTKSESSPNKHLKIEAEDLDKQLLAEAKK